MAKEARKVKNLKRKYDNIGEFNVNNYKEINQYGVQAILMIMRVHNLDYDCELTDITFPLVKMYLADIRELYEINTTGQVLKILKYIKDNDLLEKKGE